MQLDQLTNQKAIRQYLDYLKKQGVPNRTIDRKLNLSEESQITKNDNNQNKTISNTNFDINIGKINNLVLHNPTIFLNLKANTKEIIQNTKSIVNNQKLIRLGNLDIAGKIKAAPNQPTDKLTNQSEINIHQRESILIDNNLSSYHQPCN